MPSRGREQGSSLVKDQAITIRLALTALAAAACSLPAPAVSAPAEANDVPARQANAVVYGDDPCPAAASPEEIVVCARRPEEERFRIPPRFRERRGRSGGTSWAARSADLEEAQRSTRPNGCSVVGANGQTGCTAAMVRDWYAQRRADRADAARIP